MRRTARRSPSASTSSRWWPASAMHASVASSIVTWPTPCAVFGLTQPLDELVDRRASVARRPSPAAGPPPPPPRPRSPRRARRRPGSAARAAPRGRRRERRRWPRARSGTVVTPTVIPQPCSPRAGFTTRSPHSSRKATSASSPVASRPAGMRSPAPGHHLAGQALVVAAPERHGGGQVGQRLEHRVTGPAVGHASARRWRRRRPPRRCRAAPPRRRGSACSGRAARSARAARTDRQPRRLRLRRGAGSDGEAGARTAAGRWLAALGGPCRRAT